MTQNEPAETGGAGPEEKGPMAMCPMAATCRRMAEKPFPKFLLALPGLLFIVVGVLIVLIPALLVWFFALASIAMGIMILIFASLMSRMGGRVQHMHE